MHVGRRHDPPVLVALHFVGQHRTVPAQEQLRVLRIVQAGDVHVDTLVVDGVVGEVLVRGGGAARDERRAAVLGRGAERHAVPGLAVRREPAVVVAAGGLVARVQRHGVQAVADVIDVHHLVVLVAGHQEVARELQARVGFQRRGGAQDLSVRVDGGGGAGLFAELVGARCRDAGRRRGADDRGIAARAHDLHPGGRLHVEHDDAGGERRIAARCAVAIGGIGAARGALRLDLQVAEGAAAEQRVLGNLSCAAPVALEAIGVGGGVVHRRLGDVAIDARLCLVAKPGLADPGRCHVVLGHGRGVGRWVLDAGRWLRRRNDDGRCAAAVVAAAARGEQQRAGERSHQQQVGFGGLSSFHGSSFSVKKHGEQGAGERLRLNVRKGRGLPPMPVPRPGHEGERVRAPALRRSGRLRSRWPGPRQPGRRCRRRSR
jgi:hypothetical protein